MKKRPLGVAVFVIGALLLTLTGLAFGASKAAPPAGEPIVPGASYAWAATVPAPAPPPLVSSARAVARGPHSQVAPIDSQRVLNSH